MVKYPNFTDPQFLDAAAPGGLNPAMSLIAASFGAIGSGVWAAPGLLAPDAMVVTFSGMTANVSLPSPWGVVTSGGIRVHAHGTQTGQDTQAYTVNFTSLIPSTGSLTAYLAATITTINQTAFPVPGPPPGQPAYDPLYVPSVGYASNTYTVALSAVTGGIDNISTFELFRTTLSASQTGLVSVSPVGQMRAPDRRAWPPSYQTSGGALVASQAQQVIFPLYPSLTFTLPLASGAGGLAFGFSNPTTGTCTIAAAGSDGLYALGRSSVSSLTIPAGGSVVMWGDASTNAWRSIGGDVDFSPQSLSSIGYRFFPNGMVLMWAATGLTTPGVGNYSFTVTLPTPFPNAPFWAMANWGGSAPPLSGSVAATASGTTVVVTIASPAAAVYGITWAALGY
jgi:hypothetical protein